MKTIAITTTMILSWLLCGQEFYSDIQPHNSWVMIDMACPMYDAQNNMCQQLQRNFPEGAQTPCEFVNHPSKCPICMMSS